MSRKYFGTDGIRGPVGQFPITPEFILKLGWAAGMAFRKQGKCRILIGKDTRISGWSAPWEKSVCCWARRGLAMISARGNGDSSRMLLVGSRW